MSEEIRQGSKEIFENIFSFKRRVKRSTFWPWYLITNIATILMLGFMGGSLLQSLLGRSLPSWFISTFIVVIIILSGLFSLSS